MSTSLEEPAAYIPSLPECNAPPFIDPHGEEPIRAELFGLDHLEAHARKLAAAAVLTPRSRVGTPLLRRFAENGRVLIKTHRRIVEDPIHTRPRSLDAEWLIDNFHIIEDTLREVEHDLPRGYYSELPKLADGPLAGYPRVFALALALVAHSDSDLDEPRITRFVEAFQSIAPLTIGELWAVPTMLRLVLVENLRRLAEQMLRSWDEQYQADEWMARKLPAGRENAAHVEVEVGGGGEGEDAKSKAKTPAARSATLPPVTEPLVVRLLQLLRDQGPRAAAVLAELEAQLAERGLDANEVLRREHRRQAANQVSVGNCVISLRLLSAHRLERLLRAAQPGRGHPPRGPRRGLRAPGLRHPRPLSPGRREDRARLGRRRAGRGPPRRRAGPGGRRGRRVAGPRRLLPDRPRAGPRSRPHFGYRPKPARAPPRPASSSIPGASYFGSVAALTRGADGPGCAAGPDRRGAVAAWRWALLPLVLLLPVSELAVGLVNHLLTLLLPPRVLPKLDFKEGISRRLRHVRRHAHACSSGPRARGVLLERLEIHYLANPDPQLRFALLTDFADAPHETHARGRGLRPRRPRGRQGAERPLRAGRPGPVLPLPPPTALEPGPGLLDGLGAEARQAARSSTACSAGDRDTSYAVAERRPGRACRRSASSSRSTPTPRCRATRPGGWSGRWRHPLNRPGSTRRRAAWSRATASCSRGSAST